MPPTPILPPYNNEIGLDSSTPLTLDSQPTRSVNPSRSPSPSLRINLRSARYYLAKDVRAGALDGDSETDEGDISTESNNDSNGFDGSKGDDFNPILGGDYDSADDNIDVD